MPIDTKKRNATIHKWQKENRERVNMLFPVGFKAIVKEAASKAGMSISQYVTSAVYAKIMQDNSK